MNAKFAVTELLIVKVATICFHELIKLRDERRVDKVIT